MVLIIRFTKYVILRSFYTIFSTKLNILLSLVLWIYNARLSLTWDDMVVG